jgi:hypothetical protein
LLIHNHSSISRAFSPRPSLIGMGWGDLTPLPPCAVQAVSAHL